MVRLSDELYAQLQARGRHGIPLAVLVRDAIAAYLAEQPQQPTRAATAAIAARVEELAQQIRQLITRLDTFDAPKLPQQRKQPRGAEQRQQPQQPQQRKQPQQPRSSQSPPYDPAKFVLGQLCPRGHEYGTTGQSLLRLPSRNCPACVNAHKREQRARMRQQG
jgi:hypothetical protein